MRLKLLFISSTLLFTSCQLQINVASSVVNVPVSKTQVGENEMLTESKLEDFTNEQKAKLDAKLK